MSRQTMPKNKKRGQNDEEEEYGNGGHGDLRTEPELHLGEYTQASKDTIQSMLVTHRAIKNLADQYARHIADIEETARIRRSFNDLQEQCRFKDKKINNQKITINTLRGESHEQEERLAREEQHLAEERVELEREIERMAKDKETAVKRRIMQEAELKNKLDKELEKLKTGYEQQFSDRKRSLEADLQSQREKNEKQLVDLEGKNNMLLERLKGYQQRIEEQAKELAKVKEDCEDQEMMKQSLKGETRTLKAKLKMMENEFGLNTETTEY